MSMYPANWPRCVYCGDYAMDGHLTCGRVQCNEVRARESPDAQWRRSREATANESVYPDEDRDEE